MLPLTQVSMTRVHVLYATSLLICLIYIFALGLPTPARPKFDWIDRFRTASNKNATSSSSSSLFSPKNIQQPWTPPNATIDLNLDESRVPNLDSYISVIMDPNDTSIDRLSCPTAIPERYETLRQSSRTSKKTQDSDDKPDKHYFFALNLYQSAHVLPRLLGSVVQALEFLDPEDCVLSIVGSGRSNDGTTEILSALAPQIEALGATYYFSTSDIDPLEPGHDRVTELARLRNLALDPLARQPDMYSADNTTVVFLNDVAICVDDILELIHQRTKALQADMVCAMDWKDDGHVFYDSWVARGLNGDLFVEVPQSGAWDFVRNVFWNDQVSKARLEAKLPIQVYACWNGAVAFTAKPLLENNIGFRASYQNECYSGEPTLFCKDLWKLGYTRIAVIPSVNLGYSDEQGRIVKAVQGYTTDNIRQAEENSGDSIEVDWRPAPPELVKCQPDWYHPSWVEWDEPAAKQQLPFDWSNSGYFNDRKGSDDESHHSPG